MSLITTIGEVEYPESYSRSLTGTDLHRDWLSRILDILRHRYRGERVYVSSAVVLYFEEDEPSKFVVPDVFVVKGADPGRRRTFKVWEDGKVPDVVFEVTSRDSKQEDCVWKPQEYAQIGVKEYFLYDPTAGSLDPPLQGFRFVGEEHRQIDPDATGVLRCDELDMTLGLESGGLVMRDARTGDVLPTPTEAAERRNAELEAEIERLRDELRRRSSD